jgi:hypothetical protein
MTSAQREYEEGLTKIVGGTEAQKKEQRDLLLVIKNLKVAQAAYNAEATKTSATVSAYQGMSPWEQAKAWKEYSVVRTKQIDDEITKMREEGVAEDILTATRIDNIRKLTESHPIFSTKSFVTSLAEGVTNAWSSLGSGMSSAFSTAFNDVLSKAKTWSEAMKGVFTELKASLIRIVSNWMAEQVSTIAMGWAKQILLEKAGAAKSTAVAVTEQAAKKTITVVGWVARHAINAANWLISIAIDLAGAIKSVAIYIWKFIASAFASAGIWGIPIAAALIAGVIAAIAAAKPALLEGTDYVPKTGTYMLHEGERVVPRPFAGKDEGRKIEVTLVNLVTSEAVASAMSSRAGRNVIVNTITADVSANGSMRQVILGG